MRSYSGFFSDTALKVVISGRRFDPSTTAATGCGCSSALGHRNSGADRRTTVSRVSRDIVQHESDRAERFRARLRVESLWSDAAARSSSTSLNTIEEGTRHTAPPSPP